MDKNDILTYNVDKEYEARILVVDDDTKMLKLMRNYLVVENYQVEAATCGKDTLDIFAGPNDYDLLLLDLVMPDISGYDVCKILRKSHTLYDLPIIMLTTKNKTEDIVKGFEAGANDYVSKPFNYLELLARVKTLIKLRKLTRANSILQQAIEMKNQFMNMTIHDLKNPLNVIIGLTKMIKRNTDSSSDSNELLELILESSDLMINLVNELLEAAKIESGKLRLEKILLNLNEISEASYKKNLAASDMKKQKIIYNPEPNDDAFIYGDNLRIQEVVDNLVSNAIKYSPFGKTIEISIRKRIDEYGLKMVRIEVSDEGPGMTEDDKKKLFGKFQKLSAQPTGGEVSSGLGLSIVKQLVDLHDGKIWVESEVGKGTKFIVEFQSEESL
jgi:two-component system, sensor histidine kinase and response regulator